jgi:hemolysin III
MTSQTSSRAKGVLIFPDYTNAERLADLVIHCIGVPAGIAAAALILVRACLQGPSVLAEAVAVYALGLVGMLTASAAYQLTRPGLLKERLRRLDRAMIFVMIAGTYTPISATVLYGRGGLTLCAIQWALAAIGIFSTLRYPRRFERALFGLYIAMGWLLVVLLRDCFSLLSATVIALIVAGGIAYTVGAVIQGIPKIKFHNPVWHALILLAASLQYAAISLQLTGAIW